MDKAEQSMYDNLHKNTGKTLSEWIEIVKKEKFQKHGAWFCQYGGYEGPGG